MKVDKFVLAALFSKSVSSESCDKVKDEDKKDCGFIAISQEDCENNGCCWDPIPGN